jgi:hypothetical protein
VACLCMTSIKLTGVDPRLDRRYQRLVAEHLNGSEPLSAGLKALPDKCRSSFASTQAAWRFYQNPATTLAKLQEPLTEAAHQGIQAHCRHHALCVHDWSRLHYKHANKPDTYTITQKHDVGYDLQTSLIVSDQSGLPVAPVALRLVSRDGSYATYQDINPGADINNHLDEVTQCIQHLEARGFAKPLVHIIDREGDSVAHIRTWESLGCLWLVRANDNPRVEANGGLLACKAAADSLTFAKSRMIDYHGTRCWQWVAEMPVRLTRSAKPSQKKNRQPRIPGAAVNARLVVSRVMSESGAVLAEWLLLTNVSETEVDTATIALWYYWRWKIESFFKLLKSAGHCLESWLQESALAIAKRLLVAGMACATLWAIAASKSVQAAELREFLVKLSGRQMHHKIAFTNPSLLAGMWIFLSLWKVLETYSMAELSGFRDTAQLLMGWTV